MNTTDNIQYFIMIPHQNKPYIQELIDPQDLQNLIATNLDGDTLTNVLHNDYGYEPSEDETADEASYDAARDRFTNAPMRDQIAAYCQDMSCHYSFTSLAELVEWAKTYNGHQMMQVRNMVEELAAKEDNYA